MILEKQLLYIGLITIVKANLCKNPENKEVVSCWNGNYSSFNFKQVEVLHFTHNRVKSWWIFENVTITNQLFLDYNLLKDFNNVPESFFDLKELSLTHNEIKIIPKDSLTNFRKLTILRLCHNKITEIHAETFSRMLIKDLYITHNLIENLDFVNQLERVKRLILSNNRISSLDSVRSSLPKLTYLDLSTNFIANITAVSTLQFMTSIREVYLNNNPINASETVTELVIPINRYKLVKVYINTLALRCNLEKLFRINQNDRSCRYQEIKDKLKSSPVKKARIDVITISSVIAVIGIIFIAYLVYRKRNSNNGESSNTTESNQPQTDGELLSKGAELL